MQALGLFNSAHDVQKPHFKNTAAGDSVYTLAIHSAFMCKIKNIATMQEAITNGPLMSWGLSLQLFIFLEKVTGGNIKGNI